MKKMLYVLIMSMLSSCALLPEKEYKRVEVKNELLVECGNINKFSSPDMGAIIQHDTELMEQYILCKQKHKELTNVINKINNDKKEVK